MSAVHFLLRKLSICRVFFPKLERFVLLIGAVIFWRLGLKKRKGPEENMSHANDISCKNAKTRLDTADSETSEVCLVYGVLNGSVRGHLLGIKEHPAGLRATDCEDISQAYRACMTEVVAKRKAAGLQK